MSEVTVNIIGYRQLSEFEQEAINNIKGIANEVGRVIDGAARHPDFDQRWVAIARTELQQGFMALVRAIARPEGF